MVKRAIFLVMKGIFLAKRVKRRFMYLLELNITCEHIQRVYSNNNSRASKNKKEKNISTFTSLQHVQFLIYMSIQFSEKMQKTQKKPNAMKAIMTLRKNHRSTTEQKESASATRAQSGEEKQLLQLIQKSKDFASIFTKHKRSEYSGYKQINMNKSKIITFEHEHKEISRYQTPRKYQMNLKNIAKLRKRYSLEPTHFKESSRDYKKYFLESAKSAAKDEGKVEQFYSDRRCQKELKQIIKEMNTSKHFSVERNAVDSQRAIKNETYRQFKVQSVRENIPIQDQTLQTCERIRQIGKIPIKLKTLQTKKSNKNKLKVNNQKREQVSAKINWNEQEEHLCGWQTHSFYPKKKSTFFNITKS